MNATTQRLVHELRENMAEIETIDPIGPTYKRLTNFLDTLDTDTLRLIRDADINFMSHLARNRVNERERYS